MPEPILLVATFHFTSGFRKSEIYVQILTQKRKGFDHGATATIWYRRSTDWGKTWENPVKIYKLAEKTNLPIKSGYSKILLVKNRVVTIAFADYEYSTNGTGKIFYTRSVDNSATSSSPRELANSRGYNKIYESILQVNGNAGWKEQKNGPFDISFVNTRVGSIQINRPFDISPSPAKDFISSKAKTNLCLNKYSIFIVSVDGKQYPVGNYSNSQMTGGVKFSLKNYTKGIYLLKIDYNANVFSQKVVIN